MGLWATWEHYIEDRKAKKMQSINYFIRKKPCCKPYRTEHRIDEQIQYPDS